jgi:hypothetical protein
MPDQKPPAKTWPLYLMAALLIAVGAVLIAIPFPHLGGSGRNLYPEESLIAGIIFVIGGIVLLAVTTRGRH